MPAVPALPPATALPSSPLSSLVGSTVGAVPSGWQAYAVRPLDTLWDIAAHHGTTVSALVVQNRLPGGGHLLRIGQVLMVPGPAASAAHAAPARPTPASSTAPRTTTYTVRAGDTVTGIALHSPASVAQILSANGLSARSILRIGQVLRIPVPGGNLPTAAPATPHPAPAPTSTSRPTTRTTTQTSAYVVRAGDTIEGIAARLGVTQASLIKANGLRAPYLIRIGQSLAVVKVVTVATPAPAPSSANTFAGRTYPNATVAAAAAARAALAKASTPTRQGMHDLIVAAARQYGVDPHLALAIGYQESGWNQKAVSVAGAIGAMQVMPSSGSWASQLAGRTLNLSDAHDNAVAGVVILRALTRAAHSLDDAIGGYYQGLGSVQSRGMYSDTRSYVANVRALMTRV